MHQQYHRRQIIDDRVIDQFKCKTEFNLEDIRASIAALKQLKAETVDCKCFGEANDILEQFKQAKKKK